MTNRWKKKRSSFLNVTDTKQRRGQKRREEKRREESSKADYSKDQRSRQLSLTLCYYDVLLCLSGCGLVGDWLRLSSTVSRLTNNLSFKGATCTVVFSSQTIHRCVHVTCTVKRGYQGKVRQPLVASVLYFTVSYTQFDRSAYFTAEQEERDVPPAKLELRVLKE